jgi:hypothetical protein
MDGENFVIEIVDDPGSDVTILFDFFELYKKKYPILHNQATKRKTIQNDWKSVIKVGFRRGPFSQFDNHKDPNGHLKQG